MTVSHSTEKTRKPLQRPSSMFAALKIMETKTPPLRYGREPFWGAPVTPASAQVYIPTWQWASPYELPENEAVTVLDVSASSLHAMGSVDIAHSNLVHTGPMDRPNSKAVTPGYYQVTVPYWAFSGTIVHPLGNAPKIQYDQLVWIAAPTLTLLLELEEKAHLGSFKIHDSYTARFATSFESWAQRLGSIRREYMDCLEMAHTEAARASAQEQLHAFQEGYSAALSTMLSGERCKTHRPDWTHAIHAQSAASTWRNAWDWTACGRPVVSMHGEDIVVLSADLPTVLARPKPPFQFDESGRTPGALKARQAILVETEHDQPKGAAE